MKKYVLVMLLPLVATCLIASQDRELVIEAELKLMFATGDLIAIVSIANPMTDAYTFSKKEVGDRGFVIHPTFLVLDVKSGQRVHSRLPLFDTEIGGTLEELLPGQTYTVSFNLSKIYSLEYDTVYSVTYNAENLNFEPWGRIESAPVEVDMSEALPTQWRYFYVTPAE